MAGEGTPQFGAAVDDTRPIDLTGIRTAIPVQKVPAAPPLGPPVVARPLPPAPRDAPVEPVALPAGPAVAVRSFVRPPEVVVVGGPLPVSDDVPVARDTRALRRAVARRALYGLGLVATAALVWAGVGLAVMAFR